MPSLWIVSLSSALRLLEMSIKIMSTQSAKKVLDRILNYPHKEKECVYLCGPHLEPCVMVRGHDEDCECRECHPLTAKCPRCGKSKLAAKFEICCM